MSAQPFSLTGLFNGLTSDFDQALTTYNNVTSGPSAPAPLPNNPASATAAGANAQAPESAKILSYVLWAIGLGLLATAVYLVLRKKR